MFMFGRTELERVIREGVLGIEKEAEANAYAQIADLYEAAERLTNAITAHADADNPMGTSSRRRTPP